MPSGGASRSALLDGYQSFVGFPRASLRLMPLVETFSRSACLLQSRRIASDSGQLPLEVEAPVAFRPVKLTCGCAQRG